MRYHREFQCLEVTTHEALTDKQSLHFYELKKLPPLKPTDNTKDLWLKLFNAETEEDLAKIEALEVSIMSEAIGAYRNVAPSDELKRIERAMSKARHDEAQALGHAERRGEKRANAKWQGVVADKDALIAELQAQLDKK
ncbi:MAG: Rpn family recombination-promoting nuclease/putative transposase [Oscillospiraceae bacterium]|nr:Rpn family recombination-promoting nuclease/putative transposase [Oscillospiraceae bacterium]